MTRWLSKSFVRETLDKAISRTLAQKRGYEEHPAEVRRMLADQIDFLCENLQQEIDFWCAGWFPWVQVPYAAWQHWTHAGRMGVVYTPGSLIGAADSTRALRDLSDLPS